MAVPLNPSVPTIPPGTPRELVPFLSAIKINIDNLNGINSASTKAASAADLATLTATVQGDQAAPAAITGFTASGRFSAVYLSWDEYDTSVSVDHAIIYRASVDNQKLAVAIGTSSVLSYTDNVANSNDYYYWISAVSASGVEGPLNSSAGLKSSASLSPVYIKQVLSGALTANEIATDGLNSSAIFDSGVILPEHITAASLDEITDDIGTIIDGEIRPDATFDLDVTGKELLVAGASGHASDDYLVIKNGRMAQYSWNGSAHEMVNNIGRIEHGIADSGDTVTIPGYFINQPLVIVTPHAIKSFSAANSGADQAVFCDAENMTQFTAGRWQFTAVARLQLSANAGATVINWANGSSSSSPLSSGVYTTPANTEKFIVHVGVTSIRGTGTAPNYYLRTAAITVYYRVALSGGTWLVGATSSPAMGKTLLQETTSLEVSVSAGTWEFYVEAAYSDTGGTFQAGAGGYQPNSATAANDLSISRYSYELTGHTEISTGTLHWQATG